MTPCRTAVARSKVFLGPQNAKQIPLVLARALQPLGDRVEYVLHPHSGKEALDLRIAFEIGRLHAQCSSTRFLILSKDKGFDSLVAFLNQSGEARAERAASLDALSFVASLASASQAPNPQPATSRPPKTAQPAQGARASGAAPAVLIGPAIAGPLNAHLDRVVADLIRRGASRPWRYSTLRNTVLSTLGRDATEADAQRVVAALRERGWVKIDGARVTYALPNAH